MPLLSLAHFTVIEADPIALIEAGQAGGYDAIGLRIVPPFPTDHVFPVIGDRTVIRSIKRRLLETRVRVLDVEAIWLTAESDVATLEPALDTAAELGAGYVIVVGNDPDRGRLAGKDLAQYDPALFSYMHLCDAPAIPPGPEGVRPEAREGRLYPGEGGLWLADFIRAFPRDTPIAIEAPSARRAGLPPAERASLAASGTRQLLRELIAR